MPRLKPVGDELLVRAAELRAGGSKWEAVAQALNRAVDTVSAWPRRYPERWQAAMTAAERQTIGDASAESVHVLRTQLRSKDEKVAHAAARSLTQLRSNRMKTDRAAEGDSAAASPDAEDLHLIAFLRGKTDDQRRQIADSLHPDAPALRQILCEFGVGDGAA